MFSGSEAAADKDQEAVVMKLNRPVIQRQHSWNKVCKCFHV